MNFFDLIFLDGTIQIGIIGISSCFFKQVGTTRLTKLKKVISIRRKNVELYKKYLDLKNVFFPKEEKYQFNSYHTFVIQVARRNDLKKYLLKNGISTAVHYPIPIHLQPASKFLHYNKYLVF